MKYNKKTLDDVQLKGKKVIVRLDLNVPVKDGVVMNDKRIRATLPTMKKLIDEECSVIVLSHLGRVKDLKVKQDGSKSLAPVAKVMESFLKEYGASVKFVNENMGPNVDKAVSSLKAKDVLILENTRYQDVNDAGEVVKFESKNNPKLGEYWAGLADIFVNDAFGTAHRAHASNMGIASHIKQSCIGYLMAEELRQLSSVVDNPKSKYVVILGGAKVSDKLKVIEKLAVFADKILIGGGMAFTFRKAAGIEIGKSLLEEEMIPVAKDLMAKYKDKLVIANDSMACLEFADKPGVYQGDKGFDDPNLEGLDIGTKTIETFKNEIKDANTILWNGPMGVTEFTNYENGTREICTAIAQRTKTKGVFSLIGGGDSAAAAIKLGFEKDFSFISTGGGASLAYMEGSPLPGVEAITDK